MIYIFYISIFLKYNTVDKKVKKGMIIMETIFPREENAEHIFEKILANEDACERLRELFYEELANSGDRDLSEKEFTKALFDAYQNRDLSAFLMAVCGNSMFDLLRNAFLIPIRFHDKGVTNPVRLTDLDGNLIKPSPVTKQISQKQYRMFRQILDQADDIPDYEICLAYGFREKHDQRENGQINTMKIGEHLGILLLFKLPKEVKDSIKDNEAYSIVWDFMMRLEEQLPRAFMYYGVMNENEFEQQSSEIGIFLPFRHFEHQLEKNIAQANGIGLGCRERILTMIK